MCLFEMWDVHVVFVAFTNSLAQKCQNSGEELMTKVSEFLRTFHVYFRRMNRIVFKYLTLWTRETHLCVCQCTLTIHGKHIHAYTIFIFAFGSQMVTNEAQNWSILLEHLPPSLLKLNIVINHNNFFRQQFDQFEFENGCTVDWSIKNESRIYRPEITDAIPLDTWQRLVKVSNL